MYPRFSSEIDRMSDDTNITVYMRSMLNKYEWEAFGRYLERVILRENGSTPYLMVSIKCGLNSPRLVSAYLEDFKQIFSAKYCNFIRTKIDFLIINCQ